MTKIKLTIILLLSSTFQLFSGTTSRTSNNFTLTGNINNLLTGSIVLSYGEFSTYKKDTVIIRNGQFTFKGYITEPKSATLNLINSEEYIQFWIDPTLMNLSLSAKNLSAFKLTGSKSQQEQEEYDRLVKNVVDNSQKRQIEIQFINTHPKSFVSIDKLLGITLMDEMNEFIDTISSSYNLLDKSVQNIFLGKFLKSTIDKKINIKIGTIAPDFSEADIDNKIATLSDFRGKSIVLLDFWASWCGPCRKGFKTLKPLFNKYHKKGFEIIAIDSDWRGDKKSWKEAIIKDSISEWYHIPMEISSTSFLKDEGVFAKYYVQAIPRKILIDKNGIIVGNWMGTDDEIEKQLTDKIEELLNY